MCHRWTTGYASILGFVLLPGAAHGEFIEWSFSTYATQSVEVRTDLMPLPNGGNPSGLAHVILQGFASSRQQTPANSIVRFPLLSNVVFHIDYLGNADWQLTTGTIPVYMVITDLASHQTGTLTFPFDAGLGFTGGVFAGFSNSPVNANGQALTLGGNQYLVAPDNPGTWDATVQITPVSANSPEPTALILGILGGLILGLLVGVRYLRWENAHLKDSHCRFLCLTHHEPSSERLGSVPL